MACPGRICVEASCLHLSSFADCSRAGRWSQVAGALDALFAYEGPLGAELPADSGGGGGVTLRLWAPTAQSVRLLLWQGPQGGEATVLEMRPNWPAPGVWGIQGTPCWMDKYYCYEVAAYSPLTGRVEVCVTTDPYSRSLSCNGARSHICDPGALALLPPGWSALGERKPPLAHFCDVSLYELHVRDFSATDATCEPSLRGTFLAFAQALAFPAPAQRAPRRDERHNSWLAGRWAGACVTFTRTGNLGVL